MSAEEKPMEREWTEREKLLAACAVSHIPPPTGKPMDTPMTPEELAGATWDGHQNRRVVHVEKFSALIAQRDALLVAEKDARIASLETRWSESDTAKAVLDALDRQTAAEERANVLEEENARLRKSLRMHCGCLE